MIKVKSVLGALALALTATAQADISDLQERDYLIQGDGLITYDASTGLEWLDLTFTQGYSMLETEANASIWANGWQWADHDQILTLFSHGSGIDGEVNYPIVVLLGPSTTRNIPGDYIYNYAIGTSRGLLGGTDPEGNDEFHGATMRGDLYLNPDARPDYSCRYSGENPPCAYIRDLVHQESSSDEYLGMWLFRPSDPVPEPVTIDIKPGSSSNCGGTIPVAILGSDTLDVTQLDPSTFSFEGLDVREKGNGQLSCGIKDANYDGYLDFVCQYRNGVTEGTLTGELLDGTLIVGTDIFCVAH